jgi:hypothetical protein
MTIRSIITSAAIVAALGFASGSAFADHADSHINDQGFAVPADANYPGTTFEYLNDADVFEGEVLVTDAVEVTQLPQHIIEDLQSY